MHRAFDHPRVELIPAFLSSLLRIAAVAVVPVTTQGASKRHYATQESRLMLRKVRRRTGAAWAARGWLAGTALSDGDIRILLGNETAGALQ